MESPTETENLVLSPYSLKLASKLPFLSLSLPGLSNNSSLPGYGLSSLVYPVAPFTAFTATFLAPVSL